MWSVEDAVRGEEQAKVTARWQAAQIPPMDDGAVEWARM
jgi:hypothetical protein